MSSRHQGPRTSFASEVHRMYMEGVEPTEIADRLGIKINAVYQAIRNGVDSQLIPPDITWYRLNEKMKGSAGLWI